MKPYFETENGKLYHGDCLEIMPELDLKVDMVLCDLPYGTTDCSWDTIIPFKPLWKNYRLLIKENGAIALTAIQPFTSKLVMSNLEMFKYEWIYNKIIPSNPANAKIMPLKSHESVLIFGNKKTNYYPILEPDKTTKCFGLKHSTKSEVAGNLGDNYKIHVGYPKTVLEFLRPNNLTGGGFHPSQKSQKLFEYLIMTYTQKNEIILDNCFGSGTTAVACEELNRKWIGIEISEEYCEIAARRIEKETQQLKLFKC